MTKMISMFPIYPKPEGLIVQLPPGAQLLTVSLNASQYYLHAMFMTPLVSPLARRLIAAYLDETEIPSECGAYIGSAPQAGDGRKQHFFDLGPVQGGVL